MVRWWNFQFGPPHWVAQPSKPRFKVKAQPGALNLERQNKLETSTLSILSPQTKKTSSPKISTVLHCTQFSKLLERRNCYSRISFLLVGEYFNIFLSNNKNRKHEGRVVIYFFSFFFLVIAKLLES